MGSNTIFGCVVHFPCTDLHLKRNTLFADNCCVEGLVHIFLWGADIILKSVGDWLVNVVDYTKNIVTIHNRIYNYSNSKNIIDLVHCFALHKGFAIYGINGLYSTGNIDFFNRVADSVLNLVLDFFDKFISFIFFKEKFVFNFFITNRIKNSD